MWKSNRTGIWAALVLCACIGPVCAADSLPSAEDVGALSASTESCVKEMQGEGPLLLRLIFEYNPDFSEPNATGKLASLLEQANDELVRVKTAQEKLKKQIEDYEGADWDARYGQTGLWERVEADLYATTVEECIVDCYLAEMREDREKILQEALGHIDGAVAVYDVAVVRAVRAKILAGLSELGEGTRQAAVKEAEETIARDDAAETVKLEMEILKARLEGDAAGLGQLAGRIADAKDDTGELMMAALSAARATQDNGLLDMLLRKFAEMRDFVGERTLAYVGRCVAEGTEPQVFAAEAGVAAIAARGQREKYYEALEYMAGREDWQSAAVLYAAGAAVAEVEAQKAFEMLVTASRLQSENTDERLGIDAKGMAEQAAQVAYQGWGQKRVDAKGAIEAFDNYARLAEEGMGDGLRGRYAELIEAGAEDVNDVQLYGEWQYRARLVRGAASERELAEVIEECRKLGYGQIRGDAAAAYCALLLQSQNNGAGEKVLKVCSENEDVVTAGMKAHKAVALAQLRRVDEAVGCIADVDDFEYAPQAAEVLDKVAERLEELMERQDWTQLAADCNSIAEFCRRFIVQESRPPVLAEIVLVCDPNEKRGLARAEKLLAETPAGETIVHIRCRARVLAAKRKYIQAAGLWAQIADTLKPETENARTWQWWRAKCYELGCSAKAENANKPAIAHAVDVLENSFDDIPEFWSRRLTAMKYEGANDVEERQ